MYRFLDQKSHALFASEILKPCPTLDMVFSRVKSIKMGESLTNPWHALFESLPMSLSDRKSCKHKIWFDFFFYIFVNVYYCVCMTPKSDPSCTFHRISLLLFKTPLRFLRMYGTVSRDPIFEPTCACCTVGSHALLSVCLSVCLSGLDQKS